MAIPMERTDGGSSEFVENVSELLPQQTLCAANPGVGLEEPRPGCPGGDLDVEEEIRKLQREEKKLFWAEVFEMWRQEQQIQDEKDEQELEMKALLRQQDQEREEVEWEKKEKEKTMANHERLMVELKSRTQALLASTEHVAEPVIAKSRKSKCKWWSAKKRQASTNAASQDANICATAKSMQVADSELEKIRKLEKRVREAEQKKQQKALAKAHKKAVKEEKKKNKKDDKKNKSEKVKDSRVTGFWPRFLLCMGCAVVTEEDN